MKTSKDRHDRVGGHPPSDAPSQAVRAAVPLRDQRSSPAGSEEVAVTDETSAVLCDWCDEPKKTAVDRLEVSNGADDVLLHLDLCDEHAAELTDEQFRRRIVKAEKVRRIRASMV